MNEEQGLRSDETVEPMVTGSIGRVIFVCFGLIYAILCMPAINARGYPPIDPGWFAVTFLWVAAIPLSLVFDNRSFGKRFKELAIYCLVTAFFNSGTATDSVPRNVTIPLMVLGTVFGYGPIHLIIGMLIEGLSQGIRVAARSIFKTLRPRIILILQWGTFSVLLLLTCGFPFMFREVIFADFRHRGRMQAEEDWKAGRAEIIVENFNWGEKITHWFDPATGLKIRLRGDRSRISLAYKERVTELLAEQGIPEWSMRKQIPSDADLVAMLDSKTMEKIEAFPYEVNDNIVLIRKGTYERWSTTFYNAGRFLAIVTPQAVVGLGICWSTESSDASHVTREWGPKDYSDPSQDEPVFIGKLLKYPQVIFIRSGTTWVGAFHESGECLSSANRSETSIEPSILER
jgi:hypothetical protein